MDSSQNQIQHDIVTKLYSNAAHHYPTVSGCRKENTIFLDIFLQMFLSMMDSGKEKPLNSHWAALSEFGLRMRITKFISPSISHVVQVLIAVNGLNCRKCES